ncbi:pseudaminic acid biosynthesis-associated methylase [Methanococcus voltae]|uniref:Pseudaminic acid biosynthesis-associated methylase n=1 Tax=Methanococcus voltae TaxID=2188 RepID=A0A8J7UT99_METVO|nr:pseudaminic acid biosynthesis-associated methylase [Methanococcus voltae]MBP2201428.1 pseudaminic acid biosynthesis-associated methylase [Methanococcus voltae]
MNSENEQINFWKSKFGDEYTLRNSGDWDNFYKETWGVTRTELNEEFLAEIDKDSKILEVGCNRANQLNILSKGGFSNLWGVEINRSALEIARENKSFNLVEGSGFDIPFKDNFFEVVFTSGVLIHIAPENLNKIIDEIYRTSNNYIWGFEYFSEECQEIDYRGHSNKLWKNNFKESFLNRYPSLKVVKEKKIKYLANDNVDMMYLLKK